MGAIRAREIRVMVITADFQAAGSEYSAGGARRGCRATPTPIDVNSSELRSRTRRPDGKARRLSIWARKALAISTHADVSKDPNRECRGARGGRYPTGLAYSSIRHEQSSRLLPRVLSAWIGGESGIRPPSPRLRRDAHRVSDAIPPCQCCHEGLTSAWLGCRTLDVQKMTAATDSAP